MSFVNEIVSPADIDSFGLRDSNRKSGLDVNDVYEWTIDRETGTYLRYHSYNHQIEGEENFLFCRNGVVDLIVLTSALGPLGEDPRKVTWSFARRIISGGDQPLDDAYYADLRSALAVYGLSGLHGVQKKYNVQFSF